MITTSKLLYIQDNIYIPIADDYADAEDKTSEYMIVDDGKMTTIWSQKCVGLSIRTIRVLF
ncbi:hypothetical protein [Gottfriedia acidiceleris]|uniref:hypothetical protein n=1 Tax=Gottfriedia acidiceleris TaxID=371036 RepID=UPI0030009CB3